ncbi:MAG: hypothetical protein HQL32_13405, partial [Planctomycetes bacterium]|nr:hypothetical protein [Planctomycetota bacterium]
KSGIVPLLGVNSLSGHKHKRQEESIKRAADMVAYVKKKGFGGAFWYIGNEEGHLHGGTAGYAKAFKIHALAMKKIDPEIKIFWNSNHVNENVISTFFKHDGGTSDGIETHGKWPFGGKPKGLALGTFKRWQEEHPLIEKKKSTRVWRDVAQTYRKIAEKYGRKDYLIANNEYGIGNIDKKDTEFNRFRYGLIMTDMLQEHFIGGWDMTCFWDTVRGDVNGLICKMNEYKKNPLHMGMELLAEAQGGEMLELVSDNKYTYGFAALKDKLLMVYLINKSKENQSVKFNITGAQVKSGQAIIMEDTKDHWGELTKKRISKKGSDFVINIPGLSYSQFSFTAK